MGVPLCVSVDPSRRAQPKKLLYLARDTLFTKSSALNFETGIRSSYHSPMNFDETEIQ